MSKAEAKTKKKSRLHMSYAQNDARYVAMGTLLVIGWDPIWNKLCDIMNYGKRGRPFLYADDMIRAIGVFRDMTGASYRACGGRCQ